LIKNEMMPSSRRIFLGILSIILLFLPPCAILALADRINIKDPSSVNIFSSLLSIFNLSVLFAWMAAGEFGGISLLALSVMISFWLIAKTGFYGGLVFIGPFFIAALIGYVYLKIKNRINQVCVLRSEKLNEETNLTLDSVSKKKNYIESLEGKMAKYAALKEVAETLGSALILEDINNIIIKKSVDILDKQGRAMLFLVDMKKEGLELSISREASQVKTKKGDTFDHWVFRHRKSLIIEDISKDFRFPADSIEEAKVDFKSLIETPLVSENKVIGIIRMDSLTESLYTHDDLRLLDIIADLGAVAIQNALLYSRTQELAIRDGLTGLSVRRYFMERFREDLKRAVRNKGTLSLLILDVDHFKNYNDRYGHMTGDLVLRHMARIVSSAVSKDDIIARYGGEEMTILLFGVDKEKASLQAEAIRRRIEKEPFVLRRHKAHVTVSVGIANYPQDAALEDELIKIADARLYKAKAQGRNRVCAT